MTVIEREAEIEDTIRTSIIAINGEPIVGLDVIARRIRRDLAAKYPALATDIEGAVKALQEIATGGHAARFRLEGGRTAEGVAREALSALGIDPRRGQ